MAQDNKRKYLSPTLRGCGRSSSAIPTRASSSAAPASVRCHTDTDYAEHLSVLQVRPLSLAQLSRHATLFDESAANGVGGIEMEQLAPFRCPSGVEVRRSSELRRIASLQVAPAARLAPQQHLSRRRHHALPPTPTNVSFHRSYDSEDEPSPSEQESERQQQRAETQQDLHTSSSTSHRYAASAKLTAHSSP
jgi:hypothetical protein